MNKKYDVTILATGNFKLTCQKLCHLKSVKYLFIKNGTGLKTSDLINNLYCEIKASITGKCYNIRHLLYFYYRGLCVYNALFIF